MWKKSKTIRILVNRVTEKEYIIGELYKTQTSPKAVFPQENIKIKGSEGRREYGL